MALVRNGACLPSTATCSQRFAYDWDEVGRLSRARRWDLGAPGVASDPLPSATPAVDLRYTYDASDNRIVKTAVDAQANALHTVYVFASLELRRTVFDSGDYADTKDTEVAYLFAHGVRLARLHYSEDSLPTLTSGKLHVLLELPDHLGSSSIVIDKETGELAEKATYQAYGATDSDYRPDRWGSFREDYKFTGKEEDAEVGLAYFGKRFLAVGLNRWLSPDPLAVQAPGEADLNLYAYVHGAVLKATDPLGLAAIHGESTPADPAYNLPTDGSVGQIPEQVISVSDADVRAMPYEAPAVSNPAVLEQVEGRGRVDLGDAKAYGQGMINGIVGIVEMFTVPPKWRLAGRGLPRIPIDPNHAGAALIGEAHGPAFLGGAVEAVEVARVSTTAESLTATEAAADAKNAVPMCEGTACTGTSGCFVAGTPVTTGEGERVPIEQLRLGDRVAPALPACAGETLPADARTIHMLVEADDPTLVDLVRSPRWLDELGFVEGEGWIDFADIGLRGRALVVGIDAAPKVAVGSGCLVTMTMRHVAQRLLRLALHNNWKARQYVGDSEGCLAGE